MKTNQLQMADCESDIENHALSQWKELLMTLCKPASPAQFAIRNSQSEI